MTHRAAAGKGRLTTPRVCRGTNYSRPPGDGNALSASHRASQGAKPSSVGPCLEPTPHHAGLSANKTAPPPTVGVGSDVSCKRAPGEPGVYLPQTSSVGPCLEH